jgi:hypothetical protein
MEAIAAPRGSAPDTPAGYRLSASGLLVPATLENECRRDAPVRWKTSALVGAAYGVILLLLAMSGLSLPESVAAIVLAVGGIDAAAGRGAIPDLRGSFHAPADHPATRWPA